jgi:hypothetical protein
MDSLVQKIFEAAKRESASAAECRMALTRAGQIAQAYAYADSDLLGSVFGSTLVSGVNDVLENDRNEDATRGHGSRRH